LPRGAPCCRPAARERGLWNLFIPHLDPQAPGTKLSNVDYAPISEQLGKVTFASEALNCSAPDTGNMEILNLYASDAVKQRWLSPLLEGVPCDGQRGHRFVVSSRQQRQATDLELRERVEWPFVLGRDLAVEVQRTVERILFRQGHGHALEQFRRNRLLFGGQDRKTCGLRGVIERECQREDVFHDGY